MENLAKTLITLGIVLIVLGVVLSLAFKVSGKLPWLGQLPGDIVIKRDNFTFYFPLATSLLLSLILSLVLYLFRR
jgi:hypothetical protein